jgi:hypothetical protein
MLVLVGALRGSGALAVRIDDAAHDIVEPITSVFAARPGGDCLRHAAKTLGSGRSWKCRYDWQTQPRRML